MFFCAWPGAGVRHACLRSLYVFSMLTYIFLLCVDLERPCVFLNLCTRVNVGSFRTHVHNKMKALSDFVWCVCVRRRSVCACVAVRSSCAPRGRVSRAVTWPLSVGLWVNLQSDSSCHLLAVMTMATSNAEIPAAPEWNCLPAVYMFADVNDFGRINLRDLGGLTPGKNTVTGLHNTGNCY